MVVLQPLSSSQDVSHASPPLRAEKRLNLYFFFIEGRTAAEVKLEEIAYPPRVRFLIPIISLYHDLQYWGPDANEFNPERFFEGISKASVPDANLPFSGGPRVWIGQNFAMIEAKLFLARILQCFRFELSPAYAHAPYDMVTIQPQYRAHIILGRSMLRCLLL
ncbi:hypothetical protein LUZ63_013889 [Rhynchospora breviuscula]|uniref:Cytochrome P450 n=1 Tax=Rhynchospora breviuscula TaxID=2022672 RepID=A0A9Q0C9V1_9POAL|nr:hypothetical protein LUZ63_013889 [Rhynchospora breviuscula]